MCWGGCCFWVTGPASFCVWVVGMGETHAALCAAVHVRRIHWDGQYTGGHRKKKFLVPPWHLGGGGEPQRGKGVRKKCFREKFFRAQKN